MKSPPMKSVRLNTLVFTTSILLIAAASGLPAARAEGSAAEPGRRERLLMDFGWRFAFGNPSDVRKDFNTGTGYFSYLAKTGYGDGAAGADFDDRGWRVLDLPHDWAVEVPFDGHGSHSHGYKAVGRNFPDTSVGWYRKSFFIPASDLGRRISVEFDGVFRDSMVWVNGHFLGREESGYTGFAWNLSEFLNYGGNNVIAVRADATMEEGWFYEGAGIYRHLWLVKTGPLHVERNGAFVTSRVGTGPAAITARVAVVNEGTHAASFEIDQAVVDADGKTVASGIAKPGGLEAWGRGEYSCEMTVHGPKLWSIESPSLYRLITTIRSGDADVDRYETPFGIRSIRFDPDQGFFLNGKRVELKGMNNHQDHAGVGTAIPDALQQFRVERLKAIGCNAYRCAHNPPTPELLDACDRLGMVVIDENRAMGTSQDQLDHLKRMIERDRNHPSVILWSLGNEEWGIEGNEKGERITETMQAFANHLDPSRLCTVASSGGWDSGSSRPIEVMGYNYIIHGNIDDHHKKFPRQPGLGTEETTTQGTRGTYFDDRAKAHLAPLEKGDSGGNCEAGWKYYAARPFLAGLFYWTGFDYRGESTPFGYPAISSQFGILDTCGFPKDSFYYLRAAWVGQPLVHIFPHWNWPGREGQEIDVRCFSNCEEVELFLNNRSLGRKTMEKNSHLEWMVKYEPGTLLARGYAKGNEVVTDRVETTGDPAAIQLAPDRSGINADGEDVAVITVQVADGQGRLVPTADNEVTFEIQGPGKIIGMGNGDPSCHEPDRLIEQVTAVPIGNWRRHELDSPTNLAAVAVDFDDSGWRPVFDDRRGGDRRDDNSYSGTNVFRGVFELPQGAPATAASLLLRSLGEEQTIYLNGRPIAREVRRSREGFEVELGADLLRPGTNGVAVVAGPMRGSGERNERERSNPGLIRFTTPSGAWKRSLFNGLAQLIVQSTGKPGEITVTAGSPGLSPALGKIQAEPAPLRPAVASR